MARKSRIATCYLCDCRRPCEQEHVLPRAAGGTFTLPVCVSCHDAIDRMSVDEWGVEELVAIVRAVTDCPSARRLLVKLFKVAHTQRVLAQQTKEAKADERR